MAEETALPPALAARFVALAVLGQGSFGRVVLADDARLKRRVAIKLLTNQGPVHLARFGREALLTARLAHPHVVGVYDHGVGDGCAWIVYEWIEGESLYARLGRDGPLPAPAVARLGGDLASALGAAHAAGILHRDVKPGNVMIRAGGGAVLVDFGLGLDEAELERLTRTGRIVGTVAYLPPEVMRGEAATAAGDQWALGATLYRALFAAPVRFAGGDAGEAAMASKLMGAPPLLPEGTTGEALELGRILLRAMDPDPRDRFPDLADLAAALGASSSPPDPGPEPAPPAAPPPTPAPRPGGPGTGVVGLVALAALLGAAVLGGGRGEEGREPPPPAPGQEPAAPSDDPARAAIDALLRSHQGKDPELSPELKGDALERHLAAVSDSLLDPSLPARLRRYLFAEGEAARAAGPGAGGPEAGRIDALLHLFNDFQKAESWFGNRTFMELGSDPNRRTSRLPEVIQRREEVKAVAQEFSASLCPWPGRYDVWRFELRLAVERGCFLDRIRVTLDEVHGAVMDPSRPEPLEFLLELEARVFDLLRQELISIEGREVEQLAATLTRILEARTRLGIDVVRTRLSGLLKSLFYTVSVLKKTGTPPGARALAEELVTLLERAGPPDSGDHPIIAAWSLMSNPELPAVNPWINDLCHRTFVVMTERSGAKP